MPRRLARSRRRRRSAGGAPGRRRTAGCRTRSRRSRPRLRQADEGDQVDVRIELRPSRGDVAGRGLDAPARGADVGAAAQQVGRHLRPAAAIGLQRRAARRQRVERRRAAATTSAASAWRVERDLLVERLDLLARLGQARLRPGAARRWCRGRRRRAGGSARASRRAAPASAARPRAARSSAGQLHVAARDVGSRAACARPRHRPRRRARRRSRPRARRGCVPKKSSSQRAVEPAACRWSLRSSRPAAAGRGRARVKRWRVASSAPLTCGPRRRRRAGIRPRRARQARLRDLQVRVAGQRPLDQRVELAGRRSRATSRRRSHGAAAAAAPQPAAPARAAWPASAMPALLAQPAQHGQAADARSQSARRRMNEACVMAVRDIRSSCICSGEHQVIRSRRVSRALLSGVPQRLRALSSMRRR